MNRKEHWNHVYETKGAGGHQLASGEAGDIAAAD
jgi:hypothetical protein